MYVPGTMRNIRYTKMDQLTLESDFNPELSGFRTLLLPTLINWTGWGSSLYVCGTQTMN